MYEATVAIVITVAVVVKLLLLSVSLLYHCHFCPAAAAVTCSVIVVVFAVDVVGILFICSGPPSMEIFLLCSVFFERSNRRLSKPCSLFNRFLVLQRSKSLIFDEFLRSK